ncbi:uncharacterized transmembrane protein DDB_G0289901-like [Helicoverpa zea]|uniref:uncharacterized transmembrane protein DDB_G0289901-like n=1 Tax=Helicoverpa zea TaxID=7113 RepID=UPI001F598E18|nr:uncharacterized transmembrane protein DDB_G0289901-like [Helicoverpa zea]
MPPLKQKSIEHLQFHGKIVMLLLIATAAVAIARRNVRSPGSSGWQWSRGFGGGQSSGYTRSSGGWSASGSGLGRSSSNGGWRETSPFGTSARSLSPNVNAYRSPSNSAWSQSGLGSNGGYGGNSFRSYPGSNEGFADSAVVESLDYSSWDEPGLGSRSSNGWQNSGW